MATYGTWANSQIPFTGWSPTLGNGPANVGSTSGSAQFNGLTQNDYEISVVLNYQANRAIRQLMRTLLGVAPGGTATAPYTRVRAQQALNAPFELGGLVPIETVNYVNRATTAADQTALIAFLDRTTGPATYPLDPSMNGGSGGVGGINSKVLW